MIWRYHYCWKHPHSVLGKVYILFWRSAKLKATQPEIDKQQKKLTIHIQSVTLLFKETHVSSSYCVQVFAKKNRLWIRPMILITGWSKRNSKGHNDDRNKTFTWRKKQLLQNIQIFSMAFHEKQNNLTIPSPFLSNGLPNAQPGGGPRGHRGRCNRFGAPGRLGSGWISGISKDRSFGGHWW